ncbi:MAG TPA: PhoD-like phosphatase N-terminal domain-containing protein, partial [Nitrososphaeraceae archaeon]
MSSFGMSERLPNTILLVTTAIITILILSINNIGSFANIVFAQNNDNNNKLVITDGIASGDVTDNSAVVWSRAKDRALMHVQYDTDQSFSHAKSKTLLVDKLTDFAGHIKLDSLSPVTIYYYRVWFSPASDSTNNTTKSLSTRPDSMIGSFRTAPDHLTSKPVSFIVGGDLGGQNYCRRDGTGGIQGYSIFSIMQSLSPDFFIFNGDQIYGDNAC